MKLYSELSRVLLQEHPEDAAQVLESLPQEDALAVLSAAPSAVAAAAISHMAPLLATALLAGMQRDRSARIVQELASDQAANILRRMQAEIRAELLEALAEPWAGSLGVLLRYPEGTAASLMDPDVLALPGDLTAEEALVNLRQSAENVRYNLYVINREQVLIGVLNLRELLLARKNDVLSTIAHSEVLSIPARADRRVILEHPAWRDARSVPVVDERGVYLGAVRYQTMRRLDEELRHKESESGPATVDALGDLFSTGIAGVFGALATSVAAPFPWSEKRGS